MSDLPVISDRRTLDLDKMQWIVTEFNSGRHMLSNRSSDGDMSLEVYFTAEEWREFQRLLVKL